MEKIIRNNTVRSNRLPSAVLGISPGTRTVGYAILTNGELVDWGVKAFSQSWSKFKEILMFQMFIKLISDHAVTHISIKLLPSSAVNKTVNSFIKRLIIFLKQKIDEVHSFTLELIKQSMPSGIVLHNKDELMRYAVLLFPHLKSMHQKELVNKNSYYIKAFEAVLLGFILSNMLLTGSSN